MKKNTMTRTSVVYSTDPDWKTDSEESPEPVEKNSQKTVIRIELDKKQRAGKQVTVINCIPPPDLDPICKKLKTVCATGGTLKNNTIELQGDQRKKASAQLTAMGFKVKVIGI